MPKLSDAEKKTLFAWAILAIVVFLIVALIASKQIRNKQAIINQIVAPGTKEVVDHSRYYTVRGALEKYYSFVNLKDEEAVLNILSEKYIKDNKITKDNLDDFVNFNEKALTIKTGVLCLNKFKNGVYTFDMEAIEVEQNTNKRLEDVYYEIVLDGNTSLFSIKPITFKEYEDVCNG